MATAPQVPHLRSSSQKWQTQGPEYAAVAQQEIQQHQLPSSGLYISAADNDQQQLNQVYKKLTVRLVPLFMLIVGLNYLDRTSLAFASIQMTQDLQFPPAVYGLGSGLFFLSYCAMQVPANFVCMTLGVKRWFTVMLLLWGSVAAAFSTVQKPWQFHWLRLLLGIAEAGTFPGAWYAMSLWFPPDRLAFPYALLGTAVAVSQVLAAPLAAALLQLDGLAGVAGWQWVFIGEGVPSMVLALLLPWLLPDGPHKPHGLGALDEHELQLLQADYAAKVATAKSLDLNDIDCQEEVSSLTAAPPSLGRVASAAGAAAAAEAAVAVLSAAPNSPTVVYRPWQLFLQVAKVWHIWYLAVCNILKDIASLALLMWLPAMVHLLLSGGDPTQLVTDSHSSDKADTGVAAVLLSAVPYSCAAAAVAFAGSHAQHTGKHLLYIVMTDLVGGMSIICFHWFVHLSRTLGFLCLVLTLSCAFAAAPHSLVVIGQLVLGPGAAVALPCFNSMAMLGGFLGPAIMGYCVQHLGGVTAATIIMGCSMLLAGLLALLLHGIMLRDSRTRSIVVGRS